MKSAAAAPAMTATLSERALGRTEKQQRKTSEKYERKGLLHVRPSDSRVRDCRRKFYSARDNGAGQSNYSIILHPRRVSGDLRFP